MADFVKELFRSLIVVDYLNFGILNLVWDMIQTDEVELARVHLKFCENLKEIYYNTEGTEREKSGVIGAFNLYINFINIFMALLNILGDKKE